MNDRSDHPLPTDAPMNTLSIRGKEHLDNLLDIEKGRRPQDAALRSMVVDGRDALLTAASNLECGQPQTQPEVAARLRVIASQLVEQDLVLRESATQRSALKIVDAPWLRLLADRVRRMAHDDAELVANSLLRVADRWSDV